MCSPIHEQVMREQSGRLEQLVVTLIVVITVVAIGLAFVLVSLDSGSGWALAGRLVGLGAIGSVAVWTGRRLDRLHVE